MGRLRVIEGGKGEQPSRERSGKGERSSRERAFEHLYRESYGLVYSYVRSRVNSAAEAEDVVADAYLNAARAFDTFDPARAKFSTWVIKIAINCLRARWRADHPMAPIELVSEGAYAYDEDFDAVGEHELVERLMACLTDEERELVVMKYQRGLRNVDIARELGMNASTVSTKLFNAIHKMRDVAVPVGAPAPAAASVGAPAPAAAPADAEGE